MNYHFVTNDPLPLVNDVKHDGQRVMCAVAEFVKPEKIIEFIINNLIVI
jgi:hypothetical protein